MPTPAVITALPAPVVVVAVVVALPVPLTPDVARLSLFT